MTLFDGDFGTVTDEQDHWGCKQRSIDECEPVIKTGKISGANTRSGAINAGKYTTNQNTNTIKLYQIAQNTGTISIHFLPILPMSKKLFQNKSRRLLFCPVSIVHFYRPHNRTTF